MGFEKKNIYQSQLVAAGNVIVAITGGIKDGQYGKSVAIKVHGDNSPHYFTIENAAVESVVKEIPLNTWINLWGQGSKGDATIGFSLAPEITDQIATEVTGTGRAQQGGGRWKNRDDTTYKGPLVPLMVEALRAAKELRATITDDIEWKLAFTLYEAARRTGAPIYPSREGGAAPTKAASNHSAPVASPPPSTSTTVGDRSVEPKLFLDARIGMGKHKDLSWRQVAAMHPDYVDWALAKMDKITAEQKKLLKEMKDSMSPFAAAVIEQDADLKFADDDEPLF